ncbi:tripartite motif-containing protein 54-like [Ptychodera flava]|uniref:tripartite motif-containing protein 54-like n=1 Tax=Ptychodera flava TaxID=63121 RepID=UPI003969DB49
MADASESNKVFNELEKSLHCRICLQPFKGPKRLLCSHTFCKPCLIKLVKRKGELICPTCDFPCPLHNGGVSGQEDNGFVNTVMDWISKQRSTDNDNEKPFHHLLRQKVFCSVHPTNEVNIYCQTCEVALCTDCANIKHRSDKHVRGQLQQAANEYIKELKDLVRQVREKEKAEGCKICREEAEEARKKEKEIKEKAKREEERSTEKLKTQIEKKTEQSESERQRDKWEQKQQTSEFRLVEALAQYGSPSLLISTSMRL